MRDATFPYDVFLSHSAQVADDTWPRLMDAARRERVRLRAKDRCEIRTSPGPATHDVASLS
jgi:hypothetical protein